jgi:hypothetical protein
LKENARLINEKALQYEGTYAQLRTHYGIGLYDIKAIHDKEESKKVRPPKYEKKSCVGRTGIM